MIDYMYNKPSKKERKKIYKVTWKEQNDLYMDLLHANTGLLFDDPFDSYCNLATTLKQATHHESLIYGKGASVDCRLYSLR